MVESSKKLKPWREAVKFAAIEAMPEGFTAFAGPVALHVAYRTKRPKSHYRTGKFAHVLKDSAPTFKTTAPDLSKLVRSTEDALTDAGVWGDDRQVVVIHATDSWSDVSGATISITEAT